MANARVMVVDDEPIVSEVVERYLVREGFQVSVAHDGEEAAEREQQSQRIEAQPRPDLDDTGEAADREDDPDRRGRRHRPSLHEPHPPEDDGGPEVLHEEGDSYGDTGDRREVPVRAHGE